MLSANTNHHGSKHLHWGWPQPSYIHMDLGILLPTVVVEGGERLHRFPWQYYQARRAFWPRQWQKKKKLEHWPAVIYYHDDHEQGGGPYHGREQAIWKFRSTSIWIDANALIQIEEHECQRSWGKGHVDTTTTTAASIHPSSHIWPLRESNQRR